MLTKLGYVWKLVYELERVPLALREGVAKAVIVGSRSLSLNDLQALRKARSFCPEAPIIVVTTADATAADMTRALENGATAFLTWPCSSETLRRVLVGVSDTA
jgi:DNA-binding NtrC family response regulator